MDIADITQYTTNHFQQLWSSSPPLPITISPISNYIPQLPTSSIRFFETPITPLEVSKAIQSKNDNSALGPDGFTYAFYKHFISPLTLMLANIANLIAQGLPPPLHGPKPTPF